MKTKNISKKESLAFGWKKTIEHFAFLLPVMFLFLLVSFSEELISIFIGDELLLSFLSIIISIFSIFLTMGLINISLMIHDGKKPQFKDLFSCYFLFFRFFIASILYFLIVLGGFILLIIPGIIWGLQFYFVEYLVIDKKMRPIEALRRCSEIMKGNRLNIFWLVIILLLINITPALVAFFAGIIIGEISIFFNVAFLITVPVSLIATVFFYRKVLEQSEKKEEPAVD